MARIIQRDRTSDMTHYATVDWVDFVRGLVAPSDARDMQAHLASGCQDCSRLNAAFTRLAAFVRSEYHAEVPEAQVRQAKAIASSEHLQGLLGSGALPCRLLFDSFLQPAAAGVRAHGAPARQVFYEIGTYRLDLREERDPAGGAVAITGQVFDAGHPDLYLSGAPTFLVCGKRILSRAVTNDFGEFQLEYRPKRGLQLLIAIRGQTARVALTSERKR
jgi:hypothetical protein